MDLSHLGGQNLSERSRQDVGSGVGGPEAVEVLKIDKIYRRKIQNMHYLANFSKMFKNSAIIFRAFIWKIQIVEKNLKIVDEKSIENWILNYFWKGFC